MRILYIVQHFCGPYGSGSVRPFEAATRLVARGHSVTLLCGTFEKADNRDFEGAAAVGVNVVRSPLAYGQRMGTVRRLIAFRRYMRWAVAEGKAQPRPDVVFASSTPLTIGEVGRRVAMHHEAPFVFEVRDLWPEIPIALGALRNPLLRWTAIRMARAVYGAADHVVVLSPGMRDGVMKWGVPAEKISVIPNCSNNELFADRAKREAVRRRMGWSGRFVAVHAGSLGKVNNVDYLLDAALALERDGEMDVLLAIVGDGALGTRIAQRISRERITLAHMYPSVSSREVPALLSAADVGLVSFLPISPLETNSANKFFDYLAAGLPIALNYDGWQAELLHESGAGVSCPSADPVILARLLAEWKRDPVRVECMGAAARRLAEGQFDRGMLVARLDNVLSSVVLTATDVSRGADVLLSEVSPGPGTEASSLGVVDNATTEAAPQRIRAH